MKNPLNAMALMAFLLLYALNSSAQGVYKVGDAYKVDINITDTYRQFKPSASAKGKEIVYSKEFYNKNSSYIKLYFENFDLAPGDYIEITGKRSGETLIYAEKGKVIDTRRTMISDFWSKVLFDDHIELKLYSSGRAGHHLGFDITQVAYGYSEERISQIFRHDDEADERAICDSNNKERIACYKGTKMYDKARAVCKLLVNGISSCTGWLLGSDGHIMTNNHCISSTTGSNNTDFIFNYEYNDCTGGGTASRNVVATSSAFIKTSKDLDYTLVKLPVNPTSTYGYLSLSPKKPAVGDRIYIPQHPRGGQKQISVNSDNGFSEIFCVGDCATPSVPEKSISYYADTEGGSSGSPVIDYNTHHVIAIHNTGECPNGSFGRSDQLIADIGGDMPNNGIGDGTVDPDPDPACTSKVSAFPYTESFEVNDGWTQVSGDDGNWLRDASGTPSTATGPSDGADGNYYMYLEASTSGAGQIGSNATAILESPCLDLTALPAAYLSFSNHMYGNAMGTLSVEVSEDGTTWTSVWSQSGDQGDQWNDVTINLNAYLGEAELKIRFEGTTGSSYTSDMAIDHIMITSDPGNPDPDPVCITTVSSFPYGESFESNDGWVQASGDDGDWLRDASGTPSSNTGPSSAIAGSYYLYLESSTSGTGQIGSNATAILNSPCFDLTSLSTAVFSFSNHMYGSSIGSLKLEASTNGTNWTSLWSLSGNQGNQWNNVSVDLSAYLDATALRLRFVGTTGSSYTSDIAIDNLSLTSGTVDPDPVCDALNFNNFTINPFADQDASGDYSIGTSGESISLTNNTWKFIDMNYTVTQNTVIEFEFSSTSEGEIHGLGFENDNSLTPTRYFKVHGTQNYGITNFDNYTSGTVTYVIPVGSSYTGNMDRLVLINDNDNGTGNNSTFSNIKIYEGSCNNLETVQILHNRVDVLGDQDEYDLNTIHIAPNPVDRGQSLSVFGGENISGASYTITNVLGQEESSGSIPQNKTISLNGLKAGVYMLQIKNENLKMNMRFIVK